MKITELLENSDGSQPSFEVIPPVRGGSIRDIHAAVETLMEYRPLFIDVTSHSAEVHYEEMPDGSWRRKVKRKRPGTLGLCASIRSRFGVEAVPHLLCEGFTREETEDALIELNYLGINNVMALRGDKAGYTKKLPASRSRNTYACDLVEQISEMNRGIYLEDLIDASPVNFCVGVAGYPEKHFEAPNLSWDIQHLKNKVEAGADYIVTQMFFDNEKYFDFVERCRAVGIEVPIIPGLKVVTSGRQLKSLPRRFYVDIPEQLSLEIQQADTRHASDIGVEWATRQSIELLERGVPCLHYYVMQNTSHVVNMLKRVAQVAG